MVLEQQGRWFPTSGHRYPRAIFFSRVPSILISEAFLSRFGGVFCSQFVSFFTEVIISGKLNSTYYVVFRKKKKNQQTLEDRNNLRAKLNLSQMFGILKGGGGQKSPMNSDP